MPKFLDSDGLLFVRNYWLEEGQERDKINWNLKQWAVLDGISKALMTLQQIPWFLTNKIPTFLPLQHDPITKKKCGNFSGKQWFYRDKKVMITMKEIGTKTFLQITEGGNSPMRRAERVSDATIALCPWPSFTEYLIGTDILSPFLFLSFCCLSNRMHFFN